MTNKWRRTQRQILGPSPRLRGTCAQKTARLAAGGRRRHFRTNCTALWAPASGSKRHFRIPGRAKRALKQHIAAPQLGVSDVRSAEKYVRYTILLRMDAASRKNFKDFGANTCKPKSPLSTFRCSSSVQPKSSCQFGVR